MNTDQFMFEQFMPFYKRVLHTFKQNHATFFSIVNSFMSGKINCVGLRLTENETTIGEYTLYLDGASISHLKSGILTSEVHTPFGIIRPYMILEKSTIEEMIQDEPAFITNPFATKMKYMHNVTIKFFRS